MKKSILIGSNGYLGKHLSYFLGKNDFQNENYDIHPESASGLKNYTPLNILNENELKKLNPDVDFIFLFAGYTGTFEGFQKYKEFISLNEIGLLNVLTWMRESKSKARIIFPSTRLVYKHNHNALREEDEKHPKTVYAVNKLSAEQLLSIYQHMYGINYTVFRICVPYGNVFDAIFSYGTIGFFLTKAMRGENITLYGNGLIRRTFTHVEDVCMNMLHGILKNKSANEIYNIGGEDLSLLSAAQVIAKRYAVNVDFRDWPDIDLKLESGDTVFNASKLNQLIHYKHKHGMNNWILNL